SPRSPFDFVEQGQIKASRVRVHPNHKDGSFNSLWHEVHRIRGRKDYELAMEIYKVAIVYLLQDFRMYPDIDGILHNYIRDYTEILVRYGMHDDAFSIIKISIVNNFRSYYDFNSPFELLSAAILKTRL